MSQEVVVAMQGLQPGPCPVCDAAPVVLVVGREPRQGIYQTLARTNGSGGWVSRDRVADELSSKMHLVGPAINRRTGANVQAAGLDVLTLERRGISRQIRTRPACREPTTATDSPAGTDAQNP